MSVMLLADFSVIKPDFGLIFWTSIIFLLFWGMIGKYAFGPIARALKSREDDIQRALDEAKSAKEEMAGLKTENEKLLQEAREERAMLMKEAKEIKNQIISEAKMKAKDDASKIVEAAKAEIEHQKKTALVEVKNQVGLIALEMAEKVIRKELKGNAEQESYVKDLASKLNLN